MASEYTKSLIKTFVTLYGEDIVRGINNTGLFFPAVVGQLSVESANGTSYLAQQLNNFGGMKGNSSNGVLLDTNETNLRTPTQAYFKRYSNFKQFIADYVSNLQTSRYINAGVFDATTPEEQITRMVEAGYSTMSPSQYLAGGVKDRIRATQELYELGKISDQQVAEVSGVGYNETVFGMKLSDL